MSLRRNLLLALAVALGSLLWLGAAPAGATSNPDYTAVPPTAVVTTPPPARPAAKASTAAEASTARTSLAITGSDASTAAVLGLGLVAAGAAVLVIRRRQLAA